MRDQLETLVTGPVAQRQQVAILAGVLLGSDAIDQMLATLDQQAAEAGVEISPEAARINMALQQAFNSTQHELDASQRELLQSDLGWFGELAIARTQPDQREAWERIQQGSLWLFAGMMVVFGGGLLLALAGLVGLIIGVIQSFRGRLKPLPQSMGTGSISISIEVFAIWLVLFFLLNLLAGSLGAGLFGAVVAFFVSLVVLFWYPVRGVPLRQAMADNGWTRGRGWIREILAGFAGYAMMLPILAIGLVLTMLLMQLAPKGDDGFASDAGAAHPLFILLSDSTTLNLVLIYLAASVAAPIVEETLFRGVLYRHLRSLSRHWAIWLSIGMSGLVSGFIFAAIHPQGWMGIPVLAAIGFAMALAREWRNSLIAPMVMHALSNGLVMTMAILLLS
jgi:membrane protease YdiL (CAAX protease family)